MTDMTFRLPLYPRRHLFTEEALEQLAGLLDSGKVPVTMGPDGPPVGTVKSATVSDGAVLCVAHVDDAAFPDVAGIGCDIRAAVADGPDDRLISMVERANAVIARVADDLQDGARPLGG